jgi:hypothetical protein
MLYFKRTLIYWLVMIFAQKISAQNFKSQYFYLGEIIDLRSNEKTNQGLIYQLGGSKSIGLKLPNGDIEFLKNKLNTDLISKVDPYKVNLVLIEMKYTEKAKTETLVSGKLNFEGSFYLKSSQDSTTIFPFKYSVSYTRKIGELEPLYQLLDQKITDLLKNLELWFQKNYNKNYILARHVQVITKDYTPNVQDEDTLYYFQRRVKFSDFTLKKSNAGRSAAAIFTNMGYFASSRFSNDTVYLTFTVKVYQIKGMSWAIAEANSVYSINHEQTHFNITQLIAEKFKERLREEALPPLDFDSRLQFIYLEYYRKINKMQNNYDDDTKHGLDKDKQIWWENHIAQELKKYNIII